MLKISPLQAGEIRLFASQMLNLLFLVKIIGEKFG